MAFWDLYMTERTISLNKSFKKLLKCVVGHNVRRKELISCAVSKLSLTPKQAEGFVARNIHFLMRHELVQTSGVKGERAYHFTSRLQLLLERAEVRTDAEVNEYLCREFLLEETKTNIELTKIAGEIEAYRYYLVKYPNSHDVIKGLLHQAKEESSQLCGRLSAIKKLMQATRN